MNIKLIKEASAEVEQWPDWKKADMGLTSHDIAYKKETKTPLTEDILNFSRKIGWSNIPNKRQNHEI